ncbi:Nucleoporin nup61 [Daldinia childiae]|uniref:Nucleoporin nup61 n=1 Tax=Daldinia childiae TaxID=326645 RepID=UPI00144738DB|nr:Nucleoporin nup61 [Daldinia childiae]KAF3058149.1 Nucleoporin nup61 [Daldinia childiae]
MNSSTPLKPRPAPGQQGSTPFRSVSASRFRSSLVPMNKPSPARTSHLTGKVATNNSYGRDLFRTSTPQTSRTMKFAPSLPADVTKTTPGGRKFPQKTTQGGMYGIASAEPFKMRIPSPDPELSGAALSKEVPDDPNRTGTIYADQFLAHKCPPNFDDLQRRRFFCVLDLRRLKYAADEIFAKKDWKLNIMNFAKEYEKSRGLIMLRYGLYEFKNVKPSEEVLKRWRAAHNLPEPEPQAEKAAPATPVQSSRRPGTLGAVSTKRKAEEDLAPKDNALMASTANQNKRRNVTQEQTEAALTGPAPFKKSKRKADETDEPDENQPNKVQKATPTAAKSKFESILNRAQSGSTSPIKRAPLAPFGSQKSNESQNTNLNGKSNPFAGSTNIFKPATVETVEESSTAGYLSESSANSSGNENGNVDGGDTETESEGEEEAADSQEASQSAQPSVASSAGTNTPSAQSGSALFSSSNTTAASNLFGGLTKSSDLTSKGGLFGRVQMGSNGQPLRATADEEEESDIVPVKQPIVEKEQSKTPAKQPGDFTFNASTTPISFGPPSSSATKPPATVSHLESTNESSKPEAAKVAKSTASLFGASAPANPAFQPSTASLFGASTTSSVSSPMKPNGTASSLFSAQKSTPTSSLFSPAPTKSLFGDAAKANETSSSTAKEQQKGNPDVVLESKVSETPSTSKKPTSLFGASTSTTTPSQAVSLFDSSVKATESQTNGAPNGQSLFGNTAKAPASNLFGGSSSSASFSAGDTKTNGSDTAKSLFDTSSKPQSASFTFGASNPETTPTTPTSKSLFGSDVPKPTTTMGASLFGGNPAPSTNIFGAKNGEATPAEKKPATTTASSLFGNTSTTSNPFNSNPAPTEKKAEPTTSNSSSLFNSAPPKAASFTFGAQSPAPSNTQPAPAMIFGASTNSSQSNNTELKKPDLQFGAPTTGSSSFTFGQDTSAAPGSGFTFSAGGNGQSFNNPFASSAPPPAAPMFGAQPSTPNPSSSFTFGFGQQAPSTPNPAPANQGASLFGGSSNGGNGANGAPSFSFTQATPNQNISNPFAPKPTSSFSGTGSFLQAGGDFTGTNSPFPAPSSIGTTPVNGTPEPQTQHDDEEAPQEQISLITGGPGEEDEMILHEVRAKAIKFVPIVKGSDDEEERKSPWSTQGVGPLRVLKNKTSGTVRVLLRAEPRGHIAMNKAILSDIEYKAKEKTVNFVAANDEGSGLETWVLQVKKPESAQQLAGILEANKSANKK